MKKFLQASILMIVIQALLSGQAMASSRVDELLIQDREYQVNKLTVGLHDLDLQKKDLANLEDNLKRTKKGQTIYLRIETIAGAVVAVGIVIGSYKAYFPPGFRAMLSAYVTTTAISRGLIKLSDKEVTNFLAKIMMVNKDIKVLEKSMRQQKIATCEKLQYYMLCDY